MTIMASGGPTDSEEDKKPANRNPREYELGDPNASPPRSAYHELGVPKPLHPEVAARLAAPLDSGLTEPAQYHCSQLCSDRKPARS